MFFEFPKAVYDRTYRETGRTHLVRSHDEQAALEPAEDWAETPAAFDQAPEPPAAIAEPEPEPVAVPEPPKRRGRPRKESQ